jgi:hypothetical protein
MTRIKKGQHHQSPSVTFLRREFSQLAGTSRQRTDPQKVEICFEDGFRKGLYRAFCVCALHNLNCFRQLLQQGCRSNLQDEHRSIQTKILHIL